MKVKIIICFKPLDFVEQDLLYPKSLSHQLIERLKPTARKSFVIEVFAGLNQVEITRSSCLAFASEGFVVIAVGYYKPL